MFYACLVAKLNSDLIHLLGYFSKQLLYLLFTAVRLFLHSCFFTIQKVLVNLSGVNLPSLSYQINHSRSVVSLNCGVNKSLIFPRSSCLETIIDCSALSEQTARSQVQKCSSSFSWKTLELEVTQARIPGLRFIERARNAVKNVCQQLPSMKHEPCL